MRVMSDIFLQEDIRDLLYNKFVVFIGDSIQRAIYKDVVLLLQRNRYLKDNQLRAKGEMTFEKDELIEGGRKGVMVNGVNYREVRQYKTNSHLIRFYFTTRCYNTYMESVLADLKQNPQPDVVFMNSCLWDISRYGRNGVDEYKKNLTRLFDRFKQTLPDDCLLVWNATLPISKNARGGFLVPEVEFMNSSLRLDILEANFYANQVVVSHGYDMVDLHFYLRNQLHRRAGDGIHWDMTAHRRITNLLLTHIAEAWHAKLPGRTNRPHSPASLDTQSGHVQTDNKWWKDNDPNNNFTKDGPSQPPFKKFKESRNSPTPEEYEEQSERNEFHHDDGLEANFEDRWQEGQEGDYRRFADGDEEDSRHQWHIPLDQRENDEVDDAPQAQSWVFNNSTTQLPVSQSAETVGRIHIFQRLLANAQAHMAQQTAQAQQGVMGNWPAQQLYNQGPMININYPQMVNFNAINAAAGQFQWQPYDQHNSGRTQRRQNRHAAYQNPYQRGNMPYNQSYNNYHY